MKFYIRFLGLVIAERDLEGGEYIIGRSSDCDIRLTQDFISRRHGKLYSEGDRWFYQDLREGHPHYSAQAKELTNLQMIELENDIDLMLADYLDQEKTQEYDITDLKTIMTRATRNRHRIRIALSLIFVLALGLSGSYGYYYFTKPMDAKQLLTFVRPKVIEFEMVTQQEEIKGIKNLIDIKDSDIRKSIGFCSGFIIAPNIVLSAMHCIRGRSGPIEVNTEFKIKTHDQKYHAVTKVLGFDVLRDYVYLEVPGLEKYGYLEFAQSYKVGQKVYTVGNVGGEGIAIRDGIMASKTKDPNHPEIEYLRFSAAASPGNSGGPLVDGYGKIVGIVFAGTYSENYNIATEAEILVQGRENFVADLQPKKLSVKPDNILNFNIVRQLTNINIPQLYSWNEHPKYLRELNDIEFTVQVPDKLENFAHQMAENFNQAIQIRYNVMIKKMQTGGVGEGSWQVYSSEELPVFAPHPLSINTYYISTNTRGLPGIDNYELLIPPSRAQFDRFLKEKNHIALNNPMHIPRIEKSEQYHSFQRSGKMSVGSLSYVMFANLNLSDKQWENIRQPQASDLSESLIGKQGMLFDTRHFSYIRPKAHQSFTLMKFPQEPVMEKILDGSKREWTRFSWEILNTGKIDLHCANLPQGYLCLAQHFQSSNPALIKLLRQNYYQYQLGQMSIRPQFWSVEALEDFSRNVANSPLSHLHDISIKDEQGKKTIELKSLGLSFGLRKLDSPQSIRVLSAFKRQDDSNGKWIAMGFETARKVNNQLKICTLLVEPQGQDIWNTKNIKQQAKLQFFSKKINLDEKSPSEVFGICRFYKYDKDNSRAFLNDKIFLKFITDIKQSKSES